MPPAAEIPEDEQWRLINESGVLKKVDSPSEPELPLGEGICASRPTSHNPKADPQPRNLQRLASNHPMLFPTPLNGHVRTAIILEDVLKANTARGSLIYQQYGQDPNLKTVVERMIQGIPSTSTSTALCPTCTSTFGSSLHLRVLQ